MKCITCKKLKRADIDMARMGFGKCVIDTQPAHSVSALFERDCADYRQVDDDVKIKRMIWANGTLKQKGEI